MSIRLCKYLADSGLCSRRQASRLIEQGRLLVNGTLATHTCHVSTGDSIVLDGMALAAPEAKQLWLYHKPVGIDCNLTADKADSLLHVLQHLPVRLYPIGRLDKDSSGLLLLTNDGELTQRLLHPDFYHDKTYRVDVDKPLTAEQLQQLAAGVCWSVGPHQYQSRPCQLRQLASQQFEIVLTQGLNRQIRYMCRTVGLKVTALHRTAIGHLLLQQLPAGQWLQLPEQHYQQFRAALDLVAVTEQSLTTPATAGDD